jgi:hypothetical protein
VHREHLVVEVGVQHLAFGGSQLQTNEYCFKTTDDEEEQRRCAVHEAEFLMVNGEEP